MNDKYKANAVKHREDLLPKMNCTPTLKSDQISQSEKLLDSLGYLRRWLR